MTSTEHLFCRDSRMRCGGFPSFETWTPKKTQKKYAGPASRWTGLDLCCGAGDIAFPAETGRGEATAKLIDKDSWTAVLP